MTTAMRATSKCNAVDVSHSWKDSKGSNAVVVSGHMDGSVRVRGACRNLPHAFGVHKGTSGDSASGMANEITSVLWMRRHPIHFCFVSFTLFDMCIVCTDSPAGVNTGQSHTVLPVLVGIVFPVPFAVCEMERYWHA